MVPAILRKSVKLVKKQLVQLAERSKRMDGGGVDVENRSVSKV